MKNTDWILYLAGAGVFYLVGRLYDIIEAIIKKKKQ